jgi:hypothetical protein
LGWQQRLQLNVGVRQTNCHFSGSRHAAILAASSPLQKLICARKKDCCKIIVAIFPG